MSRSQPKKNRLRNNGRAVIVFVATVHPLQVVAAKQHFKNLAKHEILTKLFLINKFAKFPMNSAKFSQNMKYFYLKKLKYIHIRENPHFLVIMQYIAVIDTYTVYEYCKAVIIISNLISGNMESPVSRIFHPLLILLILLQRLMILQMMITALSIQIVSEGALFPIQVPDYTAT